MFINFAFSCLNLINFCSTHYNALPCVGFGLGLLLVFQDPEDFVRLCTWACSVFLMWTLTALTLPLLDAFTVPHRSWYICCLILRTVCFPLISSVTH